MLVISAVALAISVSTALLGINESRNSLDFRRGVETTKIAEGCMEEGIYRLKNNINYTGGSLNVGMGECTINVEGTGDTFTITVTAQIISNASYTRIVAADLRVAQGAVVVVNYSKIQ
jgi:hypothetical protein